MAFSIGTPAKPQTDNVYKQTILYTSDKPIDTNPVKLNTGLDLEKLSHAVAMGETGSKGVECVTGSAKVNNCFGIRAGGGFKHYKTKADSYEDFKRIWSNPKGYYKGVYPTAALASKWTGNDRTTNWIKIVGQVYYK